MSNEPECRKLLDAWTVPLPIRAIGRCGRGPHERTFSRSGTRSRELREAERALGADPTEANFARLKDVQDRLAVLDGTEALIEGFGASSGRPARTM